MANEDTTLEYKLAATLGAKNILTVGGSGSRALPFLALPLHQLRIVDISADQILLIKFKLETIRQLSHADTLTFWTSSEAPQRAMILKKMNLEDNLQAFYQYHSRNNPQSAPLFWGKWEKTFQTFSKITQFLFPKKIREGLFSTSNPYGYFEKHIKGFRWNLLLKIVGNKAMFNSFLYKGSFIIKNSPLSYYDFYSQAFDRLFRLDIQRSHFLQLCFCGKVLQNEALPIEFHPDIFEKIKASKVNPIYQQGSIFERVEDTQYDLISLSDVPSYLSGSLEQNYIQILAKNVALSGIVVNRFYLRSSENTNLSGFQEITNDHKLIIEEELVQMYDVQLLKKV